MALGTSSPSQGTPSFAVTLIFVALTGFALSPLMMSVRSGFWLGPQSLSFCLSGVAVAGALAALAHRHRAAGLLDVTTLQPWFVPLVLAGAPLISLAVMRIPFHAFANSADEYANLFQAETLLQGRLYNPAPPDPLLFGQIYLIDAEGRWVGQYLPGWPALIALVEAARLPAWFATPLAALTLLGLLWGALKRECASRAVAGALLAVYATSAFFILNGATFYAHCAAAASVAGTIYCLLRSEREEGIRWPILAGLFTGLAMLCRLDSFLLAALAACGAWAERKFPIKLLALGLLGMLPMAALFAAYNYSITGSPFTAPTVWAGNLQLGASGVTGVEDWTGRLRIPVQTTWRLGELADTASLLLPALYATALFLRIRAKLFRFYDALPLANFAIFLIFPDVGGFQIGPRYWFDGFAVMHLTVGSVFAARNQEWRRFAVAACLLTAAFSLARLPAQIDYFARISHERESVFRLAATLPDNRLHIILIEDFKSAWNERFFRKRINLASDFARNGTEITGPVLFARGDLPDSLARACRLYPYSDIEIFSLDRQYPEGRLRPAACE